MASLPFSVLQSSLKHLFVTSPHYPATSRVPVFILFYCNLTAHQHIIKSSAVLIRILKISMNLQFIQLKNIDIRGLSFRKYSISSSEAMVSSMVT